MVDQVKVIECYNKTAVVYAAKYLDELKLKAFDTDLLKKFAKQILGLGVCLDLGCGPGQTTRLLYDQGIKNIKGIDISPVMVQIAKSSHPGITFETGDMLNLNFEDNTVSAALAFYSIVHFDYPQLECAFREIYRVLGLTGQFLLSFHLGEDTVHLDFFLESKVNIDFYFMSLENVRTLLKETGFKLVDVMERDPYPDIEYPSKRCYVWVYK